MGEACWSDFSRDVEDLSPYRGEAHNVKSQAQWWTISKEIQAQLQRVITRASRWLGTYGWQVKPFSNQSQKVIFLILKGLQGVSIIPKVYEKVLVFFRTLEDRDRQENTNTCLAIVKKIVEISGGRITSDSQISIRSYCLIYLI